VAGAEGEGLDRFEDALPRLRGDLTDAAGNAGDGRGRHPDVVGDLLQGVSAFAHRPPFSAL
jgi:hypothetical protein